MVMESVFFLSNKLTKPVECGENRPVEQVHGGTHTHTRGQRLILLPPACRSAPAHSPTGAHPKTERDELQKILQTHSVSGIFFLPSRMHFSPHRLTLHLFKKKKKNTACACSPKTQISERAALRSRGTRTLAYSLNTSTAPWGSMTCVSCLATTPPPTPRQSPRPPKPQ